ncbi:recombination protein F [Aquisphaera giovannonii]|uniref:Recombination protein F n=1 Tax=Aquisphaera giovannonii TaxID=406548 RepID=A0A5B9VW29_9BACT|nr:AAA family ATPase [Aquisphaera giovannonii]QEH32157.1 recombination protein F [Aquisphaera giovannonii]
MATAADDEIETDDRWTKPPFLRRVRIRGYKSIEFCDVALQPLTVLVGRNASGKSNFLGALAFLADALEGGTDEAVRRHGGREAILHRPGRGTTVSLSLEAGFRDRETGNSFEAVYDIAIRLPARAKPHVLSEQIQIRNRRDHSLVGFSRKKERIDWTGFRGEDEAPPPWCRRDRLALSLYRFPQLPEWSPGLLLARFFKFAPDAIRELRKPTPGNLLERDGRNLASVLASIEEFDSDVAGRIQAYLSVIVEDIQAIRVVHYGDFETVRFLVRSTEKKPQAFDAACMSDGTLRAIAALVAAFQAVLPYGPGVIGIEEPETALHPAAMHALIHALDEATANTQILLTTHSADLLSDPIVRPSQVLVVRSRQGRTLITPVDVASRDIIAKELYSLAELQRQDQLDLDEEDLRRQAAENAAEGGR